MNATVVNASALLAAAAVALGLATWDVQENATTFAPRVVSAASPTFTADIQTAWLPADDARSTLEQRSALIEQFALEHGIAVRILDSEAVARTRDADGERLQEPLLRLARSFEFRLESPRDVDLLRGTLASWSVDLERAPAAAQVQTARSDLQF